MATPFHSVELRADQGTGLLYLDLIHNPVTMLIQWPPPEGLEIEVQSAVAQGGKMLAGPNGQPLKSPARRVRLAMLVAMTELRLACFVTEAVHKDIVAIQRAAADEQAAEASQAAAQHARDAAIGSATAPSPLRILPSAQA